MGNLFARAPAKVAASEASASRAAPNLAAYFELMEASVIETDELVATALDSSRLHAASHAACRSWKALRSNGPEPAAVRQRLPMMPNHICSAPPT